MRLMHLRHIANARLDVIATHMYTVRLQRGVSTPSYGQKNPKAHSEDSFDISIFAFNPRRTFPMLRQLAAGRLQALRVWKLARCWGCFETRGFRKARPRFHCVKRPSRRDIHGTRRHTRTCTCAAEEMNRGGGRRVKKGSLILGVWDRGCFAASAEAVITCASGAGSSVQYFLFN